MDFVALDFETANEQRSSVCEIGLSFVEKDLVVETRSWLVRPAGNQYSAYNVSIHGITPEDTLDKPEFDEIWEELRFLIEGKVVVAHNAAFDMYVLRDVLNLYGLDYPNINTLCSCTLARKVFPGLLSYSLAPVCDYLDIPLINHHRAGNDSEACAEICMRAFEKINITDFSMLADTHRIVLGTMCSENKTYIGPKIKRNYAGKPNLDAKTIIGDTSKQDSDNLFYGKTVVFTGTLTSMKREDAMQIIADIGGIPENAISTKTNFLVVGQQNFRLVGKEGLSGKMKKACRFREKGLDIEIISEQDFIENIP
jgi:DNA polymerase-3 subunit epsilon